MSQEDGLQRMTTKVQLLIIGGGCAGLSLASKIAQSSTPIKSLVVEPRVCYEDDRTWCFWKGQGSGHDHLPLTEWSRLELSQKSSTVTANFTDQPYQMLRSTDFYKDKINTLTASEEVELRLGTTVLSSRRIEGGFWLTETSEGSVVSEYVVDTRPGQSSSSEPPFLWQTFVGYELEAQRDSFDPATAQLMNFVETDSQEIEFLYVLPTTRRRALVELTVIAPNRPSFENLAKRLERQLKEKFGDQVINVIRREQGTIPMGINPSRKSAYAGESEESSYVHVGIGAGSARSSSGYTFCRIQRWSQACAASLIDGGNPLGPLSDTRLVKFMDSVFLKVLKRHPHMAPELFIGMFRKVPARRLLRFLGDSPTLLDALSLIAALPKLPFLKEAVRPMKEKSRISSEATCLP